MASQKLPSLSRKLLLAFIKSFILPLTLVAIGAFYLFSGYQYQGLKAQAQNNTRLISAYLANYIDDIDDTMKGLYYTPYLQTETDLAALSIADRSRLSLEIGDTLSLTAYSRDDFGDLLFISEGEVLYFNSDNYYRYLPTNQALESRNWYLSALQKKGKIAVTPYESSYQDPKESGGRQRADSFFISRQLKNLHDPDQENVIMVNLNTSFLDSLFSQLDASTPGIVLLTNDNGELIYSSAEVDSGFLNHLDKDSFHYSNRLWLHSSQPLDDFPLNVHVLLSASYIMRQIAAFALICAAGFLAAACIAYLLFKGNDRWIQNPVHHIRSVLKTMEQGNLDARCQPLPISEFQEIGTSVNHMAQKLQEKIHNEYELLIAQKNLQFQALQSQIRPHFIINTIYSFITLNQIGETELLNDCFYRFANILRYVLSKEQETTLGKELDFLDSYCALFHLRFGDRIQYRISCDNALRPLIIPKLLLQPLAEDAIIHGIQPSQTPCTLEISVEKHGENLYIIIEDSGVGFEPDQLFSSTSIGLKNVENRIQLWNKEVKFYIYRAGGLTIQAIIIPGSVQGGLS